jgi:anti-sigma factor RsiW
MITDDDLPMHDAPDCLGLGREDQLYNYYNGVLVGEEARAFERHLLDCIACRQKVATLDWINEVLKDEVEDFEPDQELESELNLELDAWTEDVQLREPVVLHTAPSGSNLPALYLALGGLGILGALGFGAIKLFKYSR